MGLFNKIFSSSNNKSNKIDATGSFGNTGKDYTEAGTSPKVFDGEYKARVGNHIFYIDKVEILGDHLYYNFSEHFCGHKTIITRIEIAAGNYSKEGLLDIALRGHYFGDLYD